MTAPHASTEGALQGRAARAPASVTTARAVAFVAERKADAEHEGAALAEHLDDPEQVAATLRRILEGLADAEYLAGQRRVAPGIGAIHGVRWPLLAAVQRGFRRATRHDGSAALLRVADRLLHEPHLEARWFAFGILERAVTMEPERAWQLLRRGAREADDWITVDTLAHAYGAGIATEPYRWAELELLVYSPKRWERRLVGSTIATLTHGGHGRRYGREVVDRGLPILEQLLGDAEPDVQKALAWAYRSLAAIDRAAVTAALRRETGVAVETADGNRAWVIRDTLSKLDPADAATLRAQLAGIRRRAGIVSTSPAAVTAARFGDLPDPTHWPEPPLA